MGFAEDKVKEYIQRNYPKFHNLRLDQLIDYLPCLTPADRQKIRCDTRNDGDILSVHTFLGCLWCRRGWVTELIAALESTNSSELAEEIREVYQRWQLPSQKTPKASAQSSRSPASVPVGRSAPFSDDPPLPPQRNQSRPATHVNASAPAPSAQLSEVVDYRSPVQETKFPSRSSEAAFEAKQQISTPDPRHRNAAEFEAALVVQHEKQSSPQAASPVSQIRNQVPLGEVSVMEVQTSTPVASRSDAGNLARNWDGVQPRPVCVKNGYFGNVSRSVDSGVPPAPEPAASATSENQPEENSYLSSDSSPMTPRHRVGAQAEEQNTPPLWSSQQDVLDNPLIQPARQLQVDEEQKGAQGQQDSASDISAVPFLPRVGFRETASGDLLTGSRPANFQRRGETVPPSLPKGTTTASCFEQVASPMYSEVSHDRSQYCEATPDDSQLSKGNTVDLEIRGASVPETPPAPPFGQFPPEHSPLPQRSSRKDHFGRSPDTVPAGGFRTPPSDFSHPSSTDVIPPSSPAAVSSALGDEYLEDLKPPVPEKALAGSASEKLIGDVPRATVPWPSYVTDIPANSRANRNNASGPSRGTQVFRRNSEEEEISLVKPGVLVAAEITGGPLSQQLSSPEAPYSGTSDMLRFSVESSKESDRLMLSDSTQGRRSEVSERNLSAGAENASLSGQNDDSSDGGSVRTHVVQVAEHPSADLSAAPEITRPALGNTNQPPGDFSDFAAEDQATKNASSPSICNDSQRNPRKNKSAGDEATSWHMSDSVLLAAGLTITSLVAVAFVLYKQLRK